jgi:hypothetical protein
MTWGQNQSATSAEAKIVIGNGTTWQDAFQFGQSGDFTWQLQPNWEMEIKLDRFQMTPLLNPSTANGQIIVDDVVQRVIHFNVPPSVIQAALQPGIYVFDLVMFDNSTPAIRTVLMHGLLKVIQGVSQP